MSAARSGFSIVQPEIVLAQSPTDFSHLRQPYAATNKTTTRPLRHIFHRSKILLHVTLHIIHSIYHPISHWPTPLLRKLLLTALPCGQMLSCSSPWNTPTTPPASAPIGIITSKMVPERVSTASCWTLSTPSSNPPQAQMPTIPPIPPSLLTPYP